MGRIDKPNEEGRYKQKVAYEGYKAASEMMQDNNYDDYFETLDAYGKKKIKKKSDPFEEFVAPEVKSEQRIFGKGYWWWIFKQSLYTLFSGPFIWLKCLMSGSMDVWTCRKKSNCVGIVALPFFVFYFIVPFSTFYILGGTPELVLMAIATKNIHFLDGITTEMAFTTSNYMAYGMRGFKQWLIFLSILFAFIGSRSFVKCFNRNKFELRKKADQSLPKAEVKKRSVNLTDSEKKHYAAIDRKLQANSGDYAVERDVNDDFLASVSKNLNGMFYKNEDNMNRFSGTDDDEEESSFGQNVDDSESIERKKEDNVTCKWRVIMEGDSRKWSTECGIVRRYYDIEGNADHLCPYCKRKITNS